MCVGVIVCDGKSSWKFCEQQSGQTGNRFKRGERSTFLAERDMLRVSCCFFCSGCSTCLEVHCEKKRGVVFLFRLVLPCVWNYNRRPLPPPNTPTGCYLSRCFQCISMIVRSVSEEMADWWNRPWTAIICGYGEKGILTFIKSSILCSKCFGSRRKKSGPSSARVSLHLKVETVNHFLIL